MKLDLDAIEADAMHAQRNNWLRASSPADTLALCKIARAAVAMRDSPNEEAAERTVFAFYDALREAGL